MGPGGKGDAHLRKQGGCRDRKQIGDRERGLRGVSKLRRGALDKPLFSLQWGLYSQRVMSFFPLAEPDSFVSCKFSIMGCNSYFEIK